jgi:hypothetical protein
LALLADGELFIKKLFNKIILVIIIIITPIVKEIYNLLVNNIQISIIIDKNVKQHIGKDYNTRNIIVLSLRKIGV